jgi:hypothetical protein
MPLSHRCLVLFTCHPHPAGTPTAIDFPLTSVEPHIPTLPTRPAHDGMYTTHAHTGRRRIPRAPPTSRPSALTPPASISQAYAARPAMRHACDANPRKRNHRESDHLHAAQRMKSGGGALMSQFVFVEPKPAERADDPHRLRSGAPPSFSVRRIGDEPLQRDSERGLSVSRLR